MEKVGVRQKSGDKKQNLTETSEKEPTPEEKLKKVKGVGLQELIS